MTQEFEKAGDEEMGKSASKRKNPYLKRERKGEIHTELVSRGKKKLVITFWGIRGEIRRQKGTLDD